MHSPHFAFVTLFPEIIERWLTTSVLGRALQAGQFTYEAIQLRSFSQDKHGRVDDFAYGGGGGMVLKPEPLVAAAEFLKEKWKNRSPKSIFFSPRGERLTQKRIQDWSGPHAPSDCFILFCGHYEGVDQRFIDHWIDYEISLGDFVLTGGELPALAFAEARIRLVDGVLDSAERHSHESFALPNPEEPGHLLEYPHFTRPADFRGYRVPEVLLSGDHNKIAKWRETQSLADTRRLRPDLIGSN